MDGWMRAAVPGAGPVDTDRRPARQCICTPPAPPQWACGRNPVSMHTGLEEKQVGAGTHVPWLTNTPQHVAGTAAVTVCGLRVWHERSTQEPDSENNKKQASN
eukprot:jgi/Ulvmu1/919/UM102_0002.1